MSSNKPYVLLETDLCPEVFIQIQALVEHMATQIHEILYHHHHFYLLHAPLSLVTSYGDEAIICTMTDTELESAHNNIRVSDIRDIIRIFPSSGLVHKVPSELCFIKLAMVPKHMIDTGSDWL